MASLFSRRHIREDLSELMTDTRASVVHDLSATTAITSKLKVLLTSNGGPHAGVQCCYTKSECKVQGILPLFSQFEHHQTATNTRINKRFKSYKRLNKKVTKMITIKTAQYYSKSVYSRYSTFWIKTYLDFWMQSVKSSEVKTHQWELSLVCALPGVLHPGNSKTESISLVKESNHKSKKKNINYNLTTKKEQWARIFFPSTTLSKCHFSFRIVLWQTKFSVLA